MEQSTKAQQCLTVLDNVVAQTQATRAQHAQLQQALTLLQQELKFAADMRVKYPKEAPPDLTLVPTALTK